MVILSQLVGFVQPRLHFAYVCEYKGATVQATYYDENKKCIHSCIKDGASARIIRVSGRNLLTNAQVNVASILITSVVGFHIGHLFF